LNSLGLEGALTFFYYDDIEPTSDFYRDVMGFELVIERAWVRLFRIADVSHLGLVSGERGSHKPSPTKPVRLQLMVSDAEAWFKHLREMDVEMDRDALYVGTELNIKAFAVKDLEGYTIEICEYTTPYGA
jgi:catechol 2,3-dioxygenase-like lactoylglutathione lyase family enzyme